MGPRPVREQRCRPAGRELELRGSHSRGLGGFRGDQVQARRPCMDRSLVVAPLEGEACPGARQLPSAQGLSIRDPLWASPRPGSES